MTYRLLRDPVGIRTPNLRIRSAMLYPVELQSRFPDETGGQRYQLVLNRQTVRHNSFFRVYQRPMAFRNSFGSASSCSMMPMVWWRK